ncbi:hypothetical protein BIY24_12885 [Halobacteriovorax marinus]|uniref:PD40 domain-containing protein n=1 Tax=Halobacteriovorax marinus TaxID=97084 RepID=UPI000BC2DFD5|nr:PD40 domain-containing protein [Halobacteriovorax marinus]ATH08809.1 hypothetical protein BIY24_12885 [Halobacteriovorax marinus]
MKKLIILFLSLLCWNAFSQINIVAVGEAELELSKVEVAKPILQGGVSGSFIADASTIMDVIRNDFSFYMKKFSVKKELSSIAEGGFNYSSFKTQGVSYVVRGFFRQSGNSLQVTLSVHDVANTKVVSEESYTYSGENPRGFAHRFSDTAYKKITGSDSIFNSKMIFVSDRHGNKQTPVKELYMMDFDGGNKKRLTHHGGVVISPAISHDGTKVLYSLIKNEKSKHRNINLRVYDLETGRNSLVSSRNGLNSGAVFMPGGESILLTLSHVGNAEIFIMNLKTKALKRLTNSYSPDVDPSINENGSIMTFLSGRAGKPMIYTMDMATKAVKRISFVGKFNATPRFAPDGKTIAFSSWLDSRFDIFRIDSDGSNLARLTKDFGSNEDPTYSNDGQFIAFSSQRVLSRTRAVQNIYIMDNDGEIIGAITENFGNCTTPRWTKSL